MPPTPQRRTVLAAGTAGALALLTTSCSGDGKDEPPHTPPPSPAGQVRRRAARQSAELLDRYDATSHAHPALDERLAALRATVAEHLATFEGGEARKKPRVEASTDQGPDQRGEKVADGSRGPKAPEERREALTALLEAERRTMDARTKALDTAPPELAMLLASAAAAGAVHGFLLTELRAEVD